METLKKKPTVGQIIKIADNYKAMRKSVGRAGELVLEMARHPDITEEQMREVVASYRRTWGMLKAVHESCRKNIGESGSTWRPHPWEAPL